MMGTLPRCGAGLAGPRAALGSASAMPGPGPRSTRSSKCHRDPHPPEDLPGEASKGRLSTSVTSRQNPPRVFECTLKWDTRNRFVPRVLQIGTSSTALDSTAPSPATGIVKRDAGDVAINEGLCLVCYLPANPTAEPGRSATVLSKHGGAGPAAPVSARTASMNHTGAD